MAEPFQTLEIPITGGLDQKADPRKVQLGKLLTGNNIRRAKDGAYTKRLGFDVKSFYQTNYGESVVMERAFVRDQELFGTLTSQGTPGSIYARSELATAPNNMVFRSYAPIVTADAYPVQEQGPGYSPDIALSTNSRTVCYVSTGYSGGAYATIADENLKTVILGPTVLDSAGAKTRVCSVGNTFIVTYQPNANAIVAKTYNSANLASTWSAATTLQGDVNWVVKSYDTASGPDRFFLAYQANTTNAVSVVSYWPNLTQIASNDTAWSGGANVDALGLYCQGNVGAASVSLTIVKANATTTEMEIWGGAHHYNTAAVALSNLVQSTHYTPLHTYHASVYTNGNTSTLITSFRGMQSVSSLTKHPATTIATEANLESGSVSVISRGQNFIAKSKPTKIRGSVMFHAVTERCPPIRSAGVLTNGPEDFLPTDLLLSVPTSNNEVFRPQCVVYPRYGGFVSDQCASYCFVTDSTGKFTTLAGFSYDQKSRRNGLSVVKYADTINDVQASSYGGVAYMSGGAPGHYDGVTYQENNFINPPHVLQCLNTASGSLTASSSYRYGIVATQYDAKGNIYRSAPSYGTVTLGSGGSACNVFYSHDTVTYRTNSSLSSAPSVIAVEVYRSRANTSDPLYLVNTELVTVTSGIRNDPNTAYNFYNDTVGDDFIATQRILYTSGGQFANVQPPCARLICVHRGRLWLAGTPDGNQLWPSKKIVTGEGPGFCDQFVFAIDGGGPITALASMDDKLIIFKADGIWYITGDGPADNGANNDWSEPVRVQSTVGSVTPYTATTDLGVVFQSRSGISLIDRSLRVSPFFGAPVEDYMSGKTITGAVSVPGSTEVRMPLQGGGEVRLDYRTGDWFTANSNLFSNVSSAVVWQNTYTVLEYSGNVFTENTSNSTDNGSFVTSTIEFAPVSAAGTIGYIDIRKISVLLDKSTNANSQVTLNVAVDGGSYSQGTAKTFGTNTGEIVLEYTPSSGKCRSAKVKLTDSVEIAAGGTVGSGIGMNVVAVVAETAVKQGAYPLVPAARKG